MGRMRKSRLSHYKQDRSTEHFVSCSTARTAASLCSMNRKTAAFFFLRRREIIAYELEAESEAMFGGEIEVDESYLVENVRASVDAVLRARCLFFAY